MNAGREGLPRGAQANPPTDRWRMCESGILAPLTRVFGDSVLTVQSFMRNLASILNRRLGSCGAVRTGKSF